MFTGIVRELGTVRSMSAGRLTVESTVGAGIEVGGSIAINGVCLTVVERVSGGFAADVVPETERRTTVGGLRPGTRVNLEPALTLADALDGHLVQGHVDGVGEVREVRPAQSGVEVKIGIPGQLLPFIAEKGSIAVDGCSLTVTGVDEGEAAFGVALIPHTLAVTAAGQYEAGTAVNVEVDVIARYVARLTGRGI